MAFADDFQSWLANYGTNNGGGSVGQAMALGYLPAAIAGGYQNWKNADNISDTAERAYQVANPVSTEERQRAQARLGELYTNPTAFLQKNPEFMASKDLGLDTIQNQLGRLGMANSGNAISDAMKFQTKLSSQYIDQDARRLMEMGGYQFNPASGAEMLMRGAEGEAKYKNDAIDSILATLGLLAGGNKAGQATGGNTPGGSSGQPGSGTRPGTGTGGGQAPTGGVSNSSGQSKIPGVAANALMQWMQQNGISNLTPQAINQFLSTLPMSSLPPEMFDVFQGNGTASLFGPVTPDQIAALQDQGFQIPMVNDPGSAIGSGLLGDPTSGLIGDPGFSLDTFDPLGGNIGFNFGTDPNLGFDYTGNVDSFVMPDFSNVFQSPALDFDPAEFTFNWFGD